MKRIVYILLTVVFSIPELQAQTGGNTIFNSVNIPGSARVAAMGGSYFAVKDGDIHLAAFNPSLLDSNMSGKVGMSYVDYFDKINIGYATYAHSINKKLTLGGTMQYLNYGKQTELDALGYEMGSFNAADYSLSMSAGYQYDSLWSLGATLKPLYSTLANYASFALALDAGVTYYKPSKNFTASLVVKNFGAQIKTYVPGEDRQKLPLEIQIGITKRPRHAPFRFSIVYENAQKWDLTYVNPNTPVIIDPVTGTVIEEDNWEFGDKLMRHVIVGSEFLLSENLHIRVAYNYRMRQELKLNDKPGTSGFSYGLSFKVSRFNFSYGRAIFHLAGPSNHFSVTTNLNNW